MLLLLSPAKSLDYDTALPAGLAHSLPAFTEQPLALIEVLRRQSPQQLSQLMGISDKLAALNVARYEAFDARFTADNSRQAVMAFNGDVYDGLQARSLSDEDLQWAQQHVRILSGLYGVLRPLDRMQPYRLEMGTRLATDQGTNLYQFWGSRIAEHLNQLSARQPAGERTIVNLASQEYFKSVDLKHLTPQVVECAFEDFKNGAYKIISFHAKRARGLMARFAVQQRARSVAALEAFDLDGYELAPASSTPRRLVFRRKRAD